MKTSSYSGFFKLSVEERMKEVAEFAALSAKEQEILKNADALDMDKADHMVENVVGKFALPMGVGINFVINGKDVVIPMVTEEPSVIAACSNAAKMARGAGGFVASTSGNIMIAQIQILDMATPFAAKSAILENKEEIIKICNEKDPVLVKFGGGAKDVEVRVIESGAQSYAARNGKYTSLTTWEKNENGDLVGCIEMPMAVGLVGGATKIHPAAQTAVKILGVKTAAELGQIIASAGLANNLAAMKALATEGIQRGHMSLHARNLANTVGAKGEILEKIVAKMVTEKNVRLEYAQELFDRYQKA